MKKTIISITFIFPAVLAYSQTSAANDTQSKAESKTISYEEQHVSSLLTNEAYKRTPEWGKYKALSATGWTTFGVGLTATATGIILLLASNSDLGSNEMSTAAGATIISGSALTVASIPILYVAYHNRRKAKKIGMLMGVTQLQAPAIGQNISSTPAMSFILTF